MSIPRSSPELHEGDYGNILKFNIRQSRIEPFSLVMSTSVFLAFMRPDGSVFTRTALLVPSTDSSLPDGTSGEIFYVIQDGDLDQPGNWYLQVFVEFDDRRFGSTAISFIVFPSLLSLSELIAP